MTKPRRRERLVFAALCVVSILFVASYIFATRRVSPEAPRTAQAVVKTQPRSPLPQPLAAAAPVSATPAKAEPVPERRIFFRHNALDDRYGRLGFIRVNAPDKVDFGGSLSCEALYVSAGHGICLTADRGLVTTYQAHLFNANAFESVRAIPLNGIPSRCRISADGKLAAVTVFVSGHSYASVDFSTQTLLIDFASGKILADLEDYTVLRDGQRVWDKDFNFWGVTFAQDGRHFYATLSTNRQHFLVKGNTSERTATVIHEQVECPSLSPDGTRIAYKKRFTRDGRLLWRTQVLHLDTRREIPLQEERSVDDQLEWLDAGHVLYALSASDTGPSASTNVWVAAADGSQPPKLFLKNAYSPSVER